MYDELTTRALAQRETQPHGRHSQARRRGVATLRPDGSVLEAWKGRWFESITPDVKIYWCSRCQEGIAKNARQQRPASKGWVCPTCGTGLPRMPITVIEEETSKAEILIRAITPP